MNPYLPLTPEDQDYMLKVIGVKSIDDLFEDIPEEVRLNKNLNLSSGMSELEVEAHMKKIAAMNKSTDDLVCFLGAGAYDHYIPSSLEPPCAIAAHATHWLAFARGAGVSGHERIGHRRFAAGWQ